MLCWGPYEQDLEIKINMNCTWALRIVGEQETRRQSVW